MWNIWIGITAISAGPKNEGWGRNGDGKAHPLAPYPEAMSDVVVGLVALGAGIVLCFLGRVAARLILSVWGGFVGLTLGGAVTSAMTGAAPFSTSLGWVVGILLAILLGTMAYSFYMLAVAITMGSIGYSLGAALALALGASGTVTHVAGIIVAVLLAGAALATNLPEVLLILLTASSGAVAIIGGLMLLFGAATPSDFTVATVRAVISQQRWWWTLLYAVTAVGGIIVQSKSPRTRALQTR